MLTPDRAFYRANVLYENGEYPEAIETLEGILNKGLKSGNLYYNLGNMYFKSGELGESIVNFERARRYMPRDGDLESNYDLAKSLMKRADSPEERFFVFQYMDRGLEFLTLRQTILCASVLFYILIFYIILTKVFHQLALFSNFFIVLISLVIIILFIPIKHTINNLKQGAIVIASITDARFEPLDDAAANFTVYEGMKLYILDKKGDWYKVKRPDGKVGWVKKEDVGYIGM